MTKAKNSKPSIPHSAPYAKNKRSLATHLKNNPEFSAALKQWHQHNIDFAKAPIDKIIQFNQKPTMLIDHIMKNKEVFETCLPSYIIEEAETINPDSAYEKVFDVARGVVSSLAEIWEDFQCNKDFYQHFNITSVEPEDHSEEEEEEEEESICYAIATNIYEECNQ